MSISAFGARVDPTEIQGNILRGYNFSHARHLILRITDAKAARRWLSDTISDSEAAPSITTEKDWPDGKKPENCFNIGLTHSGLRALGVSKKSLDSFPENFVEGMPARAEILGDIADSAPEKWDKPFADPNRVHLIATIHANGTEPLDRIKEQVAMAGNGKAFVLESYRDGQKLSGDYVHFGYRDSISQPRVPQTNNPDNHLVQPVPDQMPDKQPLTPIGAVLMDYDTEYEGLLWSTPEPKALGRNGTFNAFRILDQNVFLFEDFLDNAAQQILSLDDDTDEEKYNLYVAFEESYAFSEIAVKLMIPDSPFAIIREIVAAKMCGRWRNGAPLALSPDKPRDQGPDLPPIRVPEIPPTGATVPFNHFNYDDDNPAYYNPYSDEKEDGEEHDNNDVRCPFGAHIRRCNPRSGKIVQRSARHTRRLIRRGMPYGPAGFDRNNPDMLARGLLGNFIGANLGAQFEAVMCDWVNLGLQDPRIAGCNDPLVGANHSKTSWFDIPLKWGYTIRLTGLPRFVETRGGAYTFLPSIPAIRYLASL